MTVPDMVNLTTTQTSDSPTFTTVPERQESGGFQILKPGVGQIMLALPSALQYKIVTCMSAARNSNGDIEWDTMDLSAGLECAKPVRTK